MWEMSDLWILHNLIGERGKIILGASGNLGKDKDCEQIGRGKKSEREPKRLNFDL